ncbi:pyruvate kinase [Sodalis sp. CWE]|uniref:pyruvate kinase n=1 Tax=Sodalis sp. CWE TaxID=2803816 RepID=UPI001C7D91BC|nr:pyruvate kinase [Sodalis sp. CWE]MBX4181225.1 pyruvate kinase [Sodalis sp. CWE]
MRRWLRRTKIVATLGPATDRGNNLEKIIIAGANVVRLNFSHGNLEDHLIRAKRVREISSRLNQYVAILGDLQGPKIRISTFSEGKIFLKIGDKFLLDASLSHGQGNCKQVGIDYKELSSDVAPGDILLVDDGRMQLKVIKVEGIRVYTEAMVDGFLSNNKGINKLGGGLSVKTLTEKDKADIAIAARIGVDYLAVSFPRAGKDLHYARRLANDAGSHAKIISKVERAEAVATEETIDDIILASDVVMVARGDLGVEVGDSELIGIQKKLIKRACTLNRPVITATQMMESMITNPTPTRAEVMDVANAILDGTDAVMLSAETATGQFPVETVSVVANVCLGAEKVPQSINASSEYRLDKQFDNIEEATAMSAMYVANHLKGITAIVSMTESGHTALMMSRISSDLPIFALSRHKNTLNLTTLYRGVIPVYFNENSEQALLATNIVSFLRDKGFFVSGDLVIITYGDIGKAGNTNTSRILRVE